MSSALSVLLDPTSRPFEVARTDETNFLSACSRCLHLHGYTKPGPYVVEALLMYAQCKFYTERDPAGEVS